jgi:hypothetical protein
MCVPYYNYEFITSVVSLTIGCDFVLAVACLEEMHAAAAETFLLNALSILPHTGKYAATL